MATFFGKVEKMEGHNPRGHGDLEVYITHGL